MDDKSTVGRITFAAPHTVPLPVSGATEEMRRISDSVSPLNDALYDRARLVVQAIIMLDHLGIQVISASFGNPSVARAPQILVMPGRGCAQLAEGAQVAAAIDSKKKRSAVRFGCEIVWYTARGAA